MKTMALSYNDLAVEAAKNDPDYLTRPMLDGIDELFNEIVNNFNFEEKDTMLIIPPSPGGEESIRKNTVMRAGQLKSRIDLAKSLANKTLSQINEIRGMELNRELYNQVISKKSSVDSANIEGLSDKDKLRVVRWVMRLANQLKDDLEVFQFLAEQGTRKQGTRKRGLAAAAVAVAAAEGAAAAAEGAAAAAAQAARPSKKVRGDEADVEMDGGGRLVLPDLDLPPPTAGRRRF